MTLFYLLNESYLINGFFFCVKKNDSDSSWILELNLDPSKLSFFIHLSLAIVFTFICWLSTGPWYFNGGNTDFLLLLLPQR